MSGPHSVFYCIKAKTIINKFSNFAELLNRALDKNKNGHLPVKNLPEGKHHQAFELKSDFFSGTLLQEISALEATVNVFYERSGQVFTGYIEFDAHGQIECDRCLELCDIEFEGDGDFVIKIEKVRAETDRDEAVFVVGEEDEYCDLSFFMIEEISLAVPLKRSHGTDEEGNPLCDNDLARLVKKYEVNDSTPSADPRWDGLKNIKFN